MRPAGLVFKGKVFIARVIIADQHIFLMGVLQDFFYYSFALLFVAIPFAF
jgi:hypothetical protein